MRQEAGYDKRGTYLLVAISNVVNRANSSRGRKRRRLKQSHEAEHDTIAMVLLGHRRLQLAQEQEEVAFAEITEVLDRALIAGRTNSGRRIVAPSPRRPSDEVAERP
jgi:hypothetical protein